MAKRTKNTSANALKALYDGRFEDVSAAVLVVVPPRGRIISINVEAEELTGYEKSELEGLDLADIFRDEDRLRITSILNSSAKLDFRKLFEHNVIVRKRSRRKIMVDMGFRRAGVGKDLVYVFTLQDITDLKANEERVIRANEYVNNIINSVTGVMIVVDDSDIVQSVNLQGLQLLGYEESAIVGQALSQFFPDDQSSLRRLGDVAEVETRLRAKDGRLVPVLASKSQLKADRFGESHRSVVVALDISERKKNERLIAEQQMMIVQASKMSSLGEMASSIAHEINNPLQVILGRCELVDLIASDPKRNDELVSSVQLIDKMSQRIYKIIRGLQSLARDQRHDAKESADFRDIVRETLDLCEQRIKVGVTSFEVPEFQGLVPLLCHPTQISQVLLNLLNNSYDEVGGKPNAWIKLEFQRTGEALTFSVTDSGTGIPADVAERMFAPFFTTKPVGKGTGIGLSVSKSLCEAHGGTLSLDRKCPNTRFVVMLPLAQNSEKAG